MGGLKIINQVLSSIVGRQANVMQDDELNLLDMADLMCLYDRLEAVLGRELDFSFEECRKVSYIMQLIEQG